ncbi:hypothetical protein HN375_00660 [bacterium]|nr:hypothetical protein [bacterium]MBT3729799.1 hypothetical protein [bacterium]
MIDTSSHYTEKELEEYAKTMYSIEGTLEDDELLESMAEHLADCKECWKFVETLNPFEKS